MGIDITQKPEMNVVNVGDEVTSDQIAAIQNAAAPTAANPFATIADVGGGNPFDQSLNTTDAPTFTAITLTDPVATQTISVGYMECTEFNFFNASFKLGFDTFNNDHGLAIASGSNMWAEARYGYNGITFADGSFQSTAAGGSTLNVVIDTNGDWATADYFAVNGEYIIPTVSYSNIDISNLSVGHKVYVVNTGVDSVNVGGNLINILTVGDAVPSGNRSVALGEVVMFVCVGPSEFHAINVHP